MAASSCTRILLLMTAILTNPLIFLSTTTKADGYIYNSCSDADGSNHTTFGANLRMLFRYLSTTTNATGFSSHITGEVPDRVSGLAVCRGDVTPADCGSCLEIAVADIQQLCAVSRTAIIWYDHCFLRYSIRQFLRIMDSGQRVSVGNQYNVTMGASEFNSSKMAALRGLADVAARNGSTRPPMFAAGEMALGADVQYPKLYGLVQCSRDFSFDDCGRCLRDLIDDLNDCCSGKRGGRVLAASCNIRYEIYQFYNWSTLLTLPPLPKQNWPSASPFPPQSSNNTTKANGSGKKRHVTIYAITIPLAIAFSLVILMGIGYLQKVKASKINMDAEERMMISNESLFFDLDTIRQATNNFSLENKLGEGGFGVVYQGSLVSGQEIAVKRLSRSSGQGVMELKNEVILLAKLQHRNLVRLLGLCLEDEEKLLVYEYVANKSLDIYLFDSRRKGELNWERRYNIITGIARGLQYLHEESQIKIIHRDLKAGNILLDEDMNAKISDFGLARLFGGDQTQACTNRVVGTFGYMSPEYATRGHFSNKSDVFSFGVLVLEIVTGQSRNGFLQSGSITDLLYYVWDHWSRGSTIDILDPALEGIFHVNHALRCIEIGLLCVQESPNDRPSMSTVVLMLNSNSMSTRVPTQPFFFAGDLTNRQMPGSDLSDGTPEMPLFRSSVYSPNDMSATELEPR